MNKIKEYINSHRDEIVNTLVELVKIPSLAGTYDADRALARVGELFESAGAKVEVNKTYTLAKIGTESHKIGLFSHADVVPAGQGWTMCEPFEGKVIDGNIYGRGAWDDKSAVVISLYAFKIIKELGLNVKSTLIAFVGGNEETTMTDILDYKKSSTPPNVSLVLDAGYPVYLGDKGILWLECESKEPFEDLLELSGGEAINITLKKALCRVRYSHGLFEELLSHSELDVAKEGEHIVIKAEGISAHGANPQGTVNGAWIIINALLGCERFSGNDKQGLCFLEKLLSNYDGSYLGIVSQDELFGVTTATNGIIDIKNGTVKFTLDIRYGNTYTEKKLLEAVGGVLKGKGIGFEAVKRGEPSAISPNNKYVLACIEAYKAHTGQENPKPRINAGSTYSRFIEGALETGTTMKYVGEPLPTGHGAAHQPDERISVEGLLEAIEMTVEMIIACDKQQ